MAQEAALTGSLTGRALSARGGQQLAVLFIDDDSAVADSLSMVLAGAGFNAVGASDGNEAMARLKEGLRPHVVLSDYRMPNEKWVASRSAVEASPRP